MYEIRKLWHVRSGQVANYSVAPVLWVGDDKTAAEAALTAACAAWYANPDMYCAPDGRAPRMEPWLCAVRFGGEAVAEVLPIALCEWEVPPARSPFDAATFAISRGGEAGANAKDGEEMPPKAPLSQAYGLGAKGNGFVFPTDVVLTSSGWHECQYGHWVPYDGLLFASQTAAQTEADRRNAAAGQVPEHESRVSPESLAMLLAGIESGKAEPAVYLGSFAQCADEEAEDE